MHQLNTLEQVDSNRRSPLFVHLFLIPYDRSPRTTVALTYADVQQMIVI